MSWTKQDNVDFLQNTAEYFKKYKKDVKQKNPCITYSDESESKSTSKKKLLPHQKIIKKYMSPDNDYRGILIYHGLGSGKSAAALSVAEKLDRKVIIMLPASLKLEWLGEIKKWGDESYRRPKGFKKLSIKEQNKIDKTIEKNIKKKYTFISHNSGRVAQHIEDLTRIEKIEENVDNDLDSAFVLKKFKKIGPFDNKLLIVDEVHNLMTNIINPKSINGAPIRKHILNAKNLRILFLSGTPVIGDPFELGVMFNMLRGKIKIGRETFYAFPENYSEFREYFIKGNRSEGYSLYNKLLFQDRINGLVSYFGGIKEEKEREIFPTHDIIIKPVRMSSYQWKKYVSARQIELDEERQSKYTVKEIKKMKNKKPIKDTFNTYRMITRQLCNFVFPAKIKRPKIAKDEKPSEFIKRINETLYTLTKKELIEDLEIYSPKMKAMMNEILKEKKNKIFIYSEFLTLEGIGIFSRILEEHGFVNFEKKGIKNYKTFAIWSGSTPMTIRNAIKNKFNQKKNSDGKNIRIFLATSAGAEGISLQDVKKVLIMEPYWHRVRLEQVIGRAMRLCSHRNLPITQRHVNIIMYITMLPRGVDVTKLFRGEDRNESTDTFIFNKAKREKELISEFLDAMKEMAFDCSFNYEHNKNNLKKECRLCAKTHEEIYIPNIKKQLDSNCYPIQDTEIEIIEYKGKEYGLDDEGNIYDLSKEPAEMVSSMLMKKIKKALKI